MSYSYDKAGNLASATNAAGTTTYAYDVRNLVTTITPPTGRVIRFAHDDSGRRTDTWFHANSAYSRWAAHTHVDYDADGRITRTWTSKSNPYTGTSTDTDRVFDVNYSYAEDTDGGLCTTATPGSPISGLRWTEKNNLTGVYTNYCYDAANRLTMADPGNVGPTTYTYDANSNRTQVVHGTPQQTLAYNAVDQITTTGYGYDASGNTTTAPAVGAATYNGAEQMTSRTVGSTTTNYTYAGTDQVELIAQTGRSYTYGRTNAAGLPIIESFTNGSSTYSYTYDPQGTPLALEAANSHYLTLDGRGSVVALINHNGATTATYSYDPWGQATTTAVGGSTANTFQIYGYAGGLDDPQSTLVKFGQRWYDPTTGRFTQQDSLETLADPTRANRYGYAASNPINYVDPTGRQWWPDVRLPTLKEVVAGAAGIVSGTAVFAGCTVATDAIGVVLGVCITAAAGAGAAVSYWTYDLLD